MVESRKKGINIFHALLVNGLLTEREVCTVKYQTEDFWYGPSDEGARSIPKTEVWYFTVQTEQARSIIGLLYGWTESRLWAYAFRAN
jgi:hypothetical protein